MTVSSAFPNARPALWRFSVEDYARMLESGILHEDDRVELIDGEVRAMSPIGPHHSAVVKRLTRLLVRRLGTTAVVGVQDPIRLSDYTEPQPDLHVARPRADFYATALPTGADTLLVIEVADSSLGTDRAEKLPRYAAAGIPEVWLVDLAGDVVEQHTAPTPTGYAEVRTLQRGATLVCTALPELRLPIESIL
jgi:Uma2 family endonuclease